MKRLLICVVLVGCGGDDSGGGTVALEDLGTALGTVGCSKQFDCCSSAEIMEQYMGITYDGHPISTEADCVEFSSAVFTSLAVFKYQESLAMGRIEYDGDAAGDCVASIESVTCSQYTAGMIDEDAGCRPFVIAKVGDGGACTQSYECTSKNCVGATVVQDGPDTDGACMPLPGEGEACDEHCATGLNCDYDSSMGMDICQPKTADGDQCIVDDDCLSDYCDEASDTCEIEPPLCMGT
jgi:hypothetical protein